MENRKQTTTGLLLISLGFLVLISLFYFNPAEPIPTQANEVTHRMGLVGFWISYFLIIKTIGYAAFIFPVLMVIWGINLIKREKIEGLTKKTAYVLLFAFYFAVGWAIIKLPKVIPSDELIKVASDHRWGMFGGLSNYLLYEYFGQIGTILIFLTLVIVTVVTVTSINFGSLFKPFRDIYFAVSGFFARRFNISRIRDRGRTFRGRKRTPAPRDAREPSPQPEEEYASRKPAAEGGVPDEDFKERKIKITHPKPEKPVPKSSEEDEIYQDEEDDREYMPPTLELLDRIPDDDDEVSWDEFMVSAKTLEEKLADFGIQGKVVEINPGPIITRYEIEPAPGVKVNRFTSLADDLALVMRAKRIRVVAPIPGKAAIGIEIPNRKPNMVYLREIIDSPQFKSSNARIPLALGKTIAGDIFVEDLVSMPHLLVAGATGSGKSVCLNTIISSILFKSHPKNVHLAMIDPKRLELTPYKALKRHHLIYRDDINEEVVTSPANAVVILRSLEREMEKRYELLAHAGVRNIDDYNSFVKSNPAAKLETGEKFDHLPYIVLIIDELADLMLTAAREVEEPIARLTQMSRAVGIHLIVATQRPSVDVITGVIKANFPARMAFQVTTKTDSRTILDMNGAEKLLGKG
ncbi:DNA translocase FtsK, partial [candidate division KSB1 bacterium]|nr:DNA translocase FtsK [candidate division KSB1 bacterium]